MSWIPIKLPYFKESKFLPAPLPTTQEIEASTAILGERSAQKITAVGPYFVAKYGPGTSQIEGENLLFIERNIPTISVPRLYTIYRENNKLYIVMELIPGATLQTLWPTLVECEKMLIMNKLRSIFDQVRGLAPPAPGFYGSVAKGFIPHQLFRTFKGIVSVSGPFDNEQDFNLGLAQQFGRIWDINKKYSSKTSFYQRHLSAVLCNHLPTFTHSDVQRKNIIVGNIDSNQGTNGQKQMDYKVTVVDWEDAG